jgi:hypothetical protein
MIKHFLIVDYEELVDGLFCNFIAVYLLGTSIFFPNAESVMLNSLGKLNAGL